MYKFNEKLCLILVYGVLFVDDSIDYVILN